MRAEIALSARRVWGVLVRHLYVMRRSVPRLLELVYWPTVQMVLWGFITSFFVGHSSWVAQAAGVLISAVLLWDVLFRSNLGVAVTFLEEMWSRNLGQMFVSPLRPIEFVAALTLMSVVRTVISVAPAALLALPLYDVWIFQMGAPLAAFFANLLVFGWSIGLLVAALVLRFGMGAESLAWVAIFAVQPLSGVFYPVETLPEWLRWAAWSLPSAHVFEGMRAVLFDGVFRTDRLLWAMGLNVVYLALSAAGFLAMFQLARRRGLILQQGE